MRKKVYYAIGDIHGRHTELLELIKLINTDIKQHHSNSDVYIIQIGDIIDRGEDSKSCLEITINIEKHFPKNCTCIILQGNHEDHFYKTCTGIEDDALDWYAPETGGGKKTLESYGAESQTLTTAKEICETAAKLIPKEHLKFVKNLPLKWEDGDYFFCHGGINPQKKLNEQTDHELQWMREGFLDYKKPFAKIIVHGHSPFINGEILNNRINTDAGAAYGEKLKCFILPERYVIDNVRSLEVNIKAPSKFKPKIAILMRKSKK